MKSLYLSIIVWVAASFNLSSQPINNLIGDIQPPSPESAALGKYVDVPIGHFTGVPGVNIPIYTLNEGPLQCNVSISYHNSGIRVDEVASRVGLGWSLNAGGVISRTVLGIPDESTSGYLKATYDYDNLVVISQVGDGVIDSESDLFTFNFNGYSGKFIVDKDINKVVQYPRTDLKIIPSGSNLEAFTILTPDGTKYHFGSTSGSAFSGFTFTHRPGSPGYSSQQTEWYLRKIESYDGHFEINFTYKAVHYGVAMPSTEEYSKVYSFFVAGGGSFPVDASLAGGIGGDFETKGGIQLLGPNSDRSVEPVHGNFVGYQSKYLTRITTSTTEVEFIDKSTHRDDLNVFPGPEIEFEIDLVNQLNGNFRPHALEKIKVSPLSGNYICKEFRLTTSYFKYVNTPKYVFDHRLKLDKIQEFSCTGDGESVHPYVFDYVTDPTKNYDYVPWRLTRARDKWGFFNNAFSNDAIKYNIPPSYL